MSFDTSSNCLLAEHALQQALKLLRQAIALTSLFGSRSKFKRLLSLAYCIMDCGKRVSTRDCAERRGSGAGLGALPEPSSQTVVHQAFAIRTGWYTPRIHPWPLEGAADLQQ